MTQEVDEMCRVWWLAPSAYPTYAKGNEGICIIRNMYEKNTSINTKKSSHIKKRSKTYKYIELQITCLMQY